MMFKQPIPFTEALSAQMVKTALPTSLRSKWFASLPREIRLRSMFSSGVTSADLLGKVDGSIREVLSGKMTEEQARTLLHRLPGMLSSEELKTEARLRLVLETNIDLARGYGGFAQSQDVDILDEYPAQELYRAEDRKEPRDWPARWEEAGGKFFPGDADYPEGRMIALKSDPIWEKISAFGLPYAPFDYNSGMDLQDIDRDEAEDLGLIDAGEVVHPQRSPFNDGVQATVKADDGITNALGVFFSGLGIGRALGDGVYRLVQGLGNEAPNEARDAQGRWTADPDSQEFKDWFAGSKITEPDGKPLVLYHGTSADFESFDLKNFKSKTDIKGLYFSGSKDLASSFAYGGDPKPGQAHLLSVAVSMKTPATFADVSRLAQSGVKTPQLHTALMKEGFDGVYDKEKKFVIAFKPSQIKIVKREAT